MKNLKKKIFSIFTVAVLAISAFSSTALTAFAAQTHIDFDFTESSDEVFSAIEYTEGSGENENSPNENTLTIDSFNGDQALKLFVAGRTTYNAMEGHHLSGLSTSNNYADYNMSKYMSQIKIPFSNIKKGDKITFTFNLKTEKDIRGLLTWNDFASVYNADDELIIKGDRSKQLDGQLSSTNVGAGRLDNLTWIGKQQENAGEAIVGTKDGEGDKVVYSGFWDVATDVTVTITLDTATKKATITWPRTQSSTPTLETYFGGELEGSGYFLFKGFLNTYKSAYAGYQDDGALYFDNVKLTVESDYSAIPVNLTMDDSESVSVENQNSVIGFDDKPRSEFISEPENTDNKVLALNFEDNEEHTNYTIEYSSSIIKIPYTNLADDENLKISFRYKDTTGDAGLHWSEFASLRNSDDTYVIKGARYDYDTGMITAAHAETSNYICFVGYDKANHGHTALNKADTDQKVANRYVKDVKDWITCTMVIDKASGVASVTIDNGTDAKTTDLYYINAPAANGYLHFNGRPGNSTYKSGCNTSIYFDDIKIEAWKPLEIESTNLVAQDFDASEDIEITFSNAVDASEVRKALLIAESDGTVVDENRITVSNADAKTVAINVDGGLKYGKTAYVLTLDKLKFADTEGLKLAENYEFEFVTKLGKGVYVSNATALSSNSSTVTVVNPTSSATTAWVVLAFYDSNNTLLGYDDHYIESLSAGASATQTLTVDSYEGEVAKAKVLCWNNSEELVPYHIAVVVGQ